MSSDDVPSEVEVRRTAVRVLVAVAAFFLLWMAIVLYVLAVGVQAWAEAAN